MGGELAGCDCICCCRLDRRFDVSIRVYDVFSFGAEAALLFRLGFEFNIF